jgi:predicted glycosyltransferase
VTASVLFYVQHLLGIGHLARASLVAKALDRHGFEVTLVTGGRPVPGFPPPGVGTLCLPALASAPGFSGLVDADGRIPDQAFLDSRRDSLLDTYRRIGPDVLLIEAYPFGRRQMRFELEPLVALARAASSPTRLIASSLRDILQEGRKPGRDAEAAAIVRSAFDLVVVHGDPAFMPLEATFPAAAAIADLVRYSGIVSAPPGELEGEAADIVVSAGGGAAGARLMQVALEAARMDAGASGRWRLVTGHNMPTDIFARLCRDLPAGVAIERHRSDFRALLAHCAVSVSQAGYNTAADVLEAGCRSVMVPFDEGGETEQTRRAEALAARHIARCLKPADLTPQTLLGEVRMALAAPPPAAGQRPQLGGGAKTAAILAERLSALR